MDQELKGLPVSCKAGCSACCQQWVGVFWGEALSMLLEAQRVKFSIDTKELERQAKMALEPGMTRQKWFGNKCVFLAKDGKCGIYKARPLSCRSVYVSSEPERCGDPNGKVRRYDFTRPDYDQNRAETWGPVIGGMARIRALHYQDMVSDIVGPIPLMVQLVRQGKTPNDIREKVRHETGVVGLDEGTRQTRSRIIAPDAQERP